MRRTSVGVAASAALCIAASVGPARPPVKQPAPAPVFPAVLFTATGKFPHEVAAAYGDFTLAGPKADTLKPLPKAVRHVASDPAGKRLYGISNHAVFRVDIAKGGTTELKPPADLPKLSWTCGIAFDTKRERVVVATLGGVGHLYSYTPKTGEWAVISELDNLDLAALAYDAQADRLYGLYQPHRGGPKVGVFNAEGAVVGAVDLSDPMFPAKLVQDPVGRPVQLVVVGGELVVITEDRIFAVDLKTEKVRVTWTRK
ncbi:MAG: hypothetical protein K2X82_11980 [Gemmataceae bacterium]|nr:hypothetical protein [Gemmataceae bacterium]